MYMLKINISTIDINSISNIGSLNIGKTILCNNHASTTEYPTPEDSVENGEEAAPSEEQAPIPGEVPIPGMGQAPIPGEVPVPGVIPAPSPASNTLGPNVSGPSI
jgi:hypothetical protein